MEVIDRIDKAIEYHRESIKELEVVKDLILTDASRPSGYEEKRGQHKNTRYGNSITEDKDKVR